MNPYRKLQAGEMDREIGENTLMKNPFKNSKQKNFVFQLEK